MEERALEGLLVLELLLLAVCLAAAAAEAFTVALGTATWTGMSTLIAAAVVECALEEPAELATSTTLRPVIACGVSALG